jgi:CubicO group peptidase (beta-lactamase class C family)
MIHLPQQPVRHALAVLVAVVLHAIPADAQVPLSAPPEAAAVDSIFARFAGDATPGCAVGVSRAGAPVLARAYGMANLEHEIPNRPETVIEAGSVSKQLTAAAVVLLAQDGAVSLDDDVRTHLPEVPDYGTPLTLRHLLNHTSGLRDWGSVAAIGGWPRGTRVHTHAHVLEIVGRQSALNHPPGEHYSYTNTGYNLLVILVERVAGVSFAEFTRARLFEPLGMTRTEWRDDHARIVPGRATAYQPAGGGGFRSQMPFEDVHGNGGLLTTVGDLLTWTGALAAGRVAGPAFTEAMHARGRLNGGREIEYAAGLFVGGRDGVAEISHSGATAGYRAWLARYPDEEVAVAVLCNASHAGVRTLGHAVADLYLPGAAADPAPIAGAALPPEVAGVRVGVYRGTRMKEGIRIEAGDGSLRIANGPALLPVSETRFRTPGGAELVFDPVAREGERSGFAMVMPDGDTLRYEPVQAFSPSPGQLAEYAGRYRSEDAEADFELGVEDDGLVLRRRFGEPVPLRAIYPDAFESTVGTVRFVRDSRGAVVEMSLVTGRVWDMRFQRGR